MIDDGGSGLEVSFERIGLHFPVQIDVLEGKVWLVLDSGNEIFAVSDKAESWLFHHFFGLLVSFGYTWSLYDNWFLRFRYHSIRL